MTKRDNPWGPPIAIMRKGEVYFRLPLSTIQGAKAPIVIDPDICRGAPSLRGVGVSAFIIAARVLGARKSIEEVCQGYGITLAQVQAAIEYVKGE